MCVAYVGFVDVYGVVGSFGWEYVCGGISIGLVLFFLDGVWGWFLGCFWGRVLGVFVS